MNCKFFRLCAVAFLAITAVGISGQANADVIFFTNDAPVTAAPSTGGLLDTGTNISTDLPLTVSVVEIPGLFLTVDAATSFDPSSTTINASGTSFGLNSPTPADGTENASRFDVDAEESLTFSFSQDVTILNADFINFTNPETFSFGGVTITQPELDASNIFTFANGGLVVPANTGILLEAGGPAGSSVGLVSIEIVTAIPEPTSLALLGFGSVVMIVRRRRR